MNPNDFFRIKMKKKENTVRKIKGLLGWNLVEEIHLE